MTQGQIHNLDDYARYINDCLADGTAVNYNKITSKNSWTSLIPEDCDGMGIVYIATDGEKAIRLEDGQAAVVGSVPRMVLLQALKECTVRLEGMIDIFLQMLDPGNDSAEARQLRDAIIQYNK